MHGDSWDFRDANIYLDVDTAGVTDALKDRQFRFYRLENLHSEDCPVRLVQCIPCGEIVPQYQMMSHACLNQRRCCFVNNVHGVSEFPGPCPCQFTASQRRTLEAGHEDVIGGVGQKTTIDRCDSEVHASESEPTARALAEDWFKRQVTGYSFFAVFY